MGMGGTGAGRNPKCATQSNWNKRLTYPIYLKIDKIRLKSLLNDIVLGLFNYSKVDRF